MPEGADASRQVTLRTNTRAAALDPSRRLVTLSSGEQLAYDNLLLATGARPKSLDVPGGDLPGLHYLRTVDDSDVLRTVANRRPGQAGVVIGGGRLGVELAASFARLGTRVTLLAKHAKLWPHALGDRLSTVLCDLLSEGGIDVRVGDPCVRLDGDGRVQRAIAASGDAVPCDFAVAAVGATADTRLARGTALHVERAILTDDRARTNLPGIHAAGDCAKMFDPRYAKHRHVDHWDHAGVSGAIAATTMAGGDEPWAVPSWFFTEVFGHVLNGWGEPRLIHHRLVRGSGHHTCEIGIDASDRICSAVTLGRPSEHDALRDLVAARTAVAGREEALKDDTRPLPSG
jgi:NADPH-dependent 2,4-dienoyl-CoA reductase/sulfur reductase-like enzyme